MPVKDWMSKDLVTIDADTSIMKASKVMKQNEIQHLPVLRKGRLVGIVSDRDLKEASPSKATTLDIHEMYYLLDKITVKSLMPKHLYTIAPGDTVEVSLRRHRRFAEGRIRRVVTPGPARVTADLLRSPEVPEGLRREPRHPREALEDDPARSRGDGRRRYRRHR